MSQTPEEKVMQKIISVLNENTTVDSYVNTRVYASHISSISEPKFPAISLFLSSSQAIFQTMGMVEMRIQIDCWMQASLYTMTDVLAMVGAIRESLQRQSLIDNDIGVFVGTCYENQPAGPLLHEKDQDLFHYPMFYYVVAR